MALLQLLRAGAYVGIGVGALVGLKVFFHFVR